jgi:hexokinase
MKFNEITELAMNDLQETTQDKSKSIINRENSNFNNDLVVLKQEYQKRYKELLLWVQTERDKLGIRHQQKIQNIQIQ